MIPRDTIEKIYSVAHIEEVVGDYVSLKKRGANFIGLCPFHDEKTGSFTVSPSKGFFKCFGCGKSGNVAGFVMEIEQCSYFEALKILAKRYHIEIEERELTPEEKQLQDDRESMFVVNDFAIKWFESQLWDSREGQAIGLSYLRERGLHDDTIRKFHIGYSPDKSLLSQEAIRKGYDHKYLLNDSQNPPYIGTGLCLQSEDGRLYDRFHSRVMFPFFSRSGKVVGFAGRLLKSNDKVGKYVNSPTSPLFEKHNELFGLFQAKQAITRLNQCYLVEGQMDVISMVQAGIENVVASGGTSLTGPQIKLLHRFTSNITILYDGDKAGIKAALRGIDMVLQEGVNVKVVLLPDGEDPDSYARSHNASEFIEYIEQHQTDFIRFKTQLLSEEAGNDPTQRSELIKSVVQSIAVIPDTITRQVYIKDCSTLLHIQENILAREVTKLRNGAATNETPIIADTSTPKIQDALQKNFLELIRLIVRDGEKPLAQDGQGNIIMVGEYIIQQLQLENILPTDPIHQKIIDEYLAHYQDVHFEASTFFMHHADFQINQLATQLIADPYQLSRIYTKQTISQNVVQAIKPQDQEINLLELSNKLLLELKYTIVNQRILAVEQQLKNTQDWNLQKELITEQTQLTNCRNEINKALGNRIITL